MANLIGELLVAAMELRRREGGRYGQLRLREWGRALEKHPGQDSSSFAWPSRQLHVQALASGVGEWQWAASCCVALLSVSLFIDWKHDLFLSCSHDSVQRLDPPQKQKMFIYTCPPSLVTGSSSKTYWIERNRTGKEGTLKLEPGSEEIDNRLPNCNILRK
jgi:hypothetical protein